MASDIILIRGLFRGKYHWGAFPDTLQSFFPNQNVISVDIPGAGDLFFQDSPSSIEGMVESIRSQLNRSKKFNIISISMGGMIALKWAELYPEEVDHLVCINTNAKGFSPFYHRLILKNYVTILRALFSSPHQKERLIYSMVSNKALDVKVIEDWVAINQAHPMRRKNFFRQFSAALKFEAEKPNCKLLFISSRLDRLVSYKATQAIAKKWNETLIENPLDGHDIPLDNPEWLCQQLVKWIKD
ncbi:alpha/beta fold hydrolase [Marinomonas transparens]|uniref:Alpha/beta hydrolase n=1 Tax=Marinomonas transparens TaxID=2795388 RepID=A0A934JNN7_9GAMM|nr:alpha/beta hydrolase [Marinomonas transparens]MBJ7536883.1 alpha/beta hydrolase [Marinomonas transparens]